MVRAVWVQAGLSWHSHGCGFFRVVSSGGLMMANPFWKTYGQRDRDERQTGGKVATDRSKHTEEEKARKRTHVRNTSHTNPLECGQPRAAWVRSNLL